MDPAFAKAFNKILHPLSKDKRHGSSHGDSSEAPSSVSTPAISTADLSGSDNRLAQQLEWLTGNFYLRVVVREGHNLITTEADTTDPFVRVTLGEEASSLVDDTTRVCYRNTEPLWEESLMFPIQGKSNETQVRLAVFDKNNVMKSMKAIFMGQVTTTLGVLLSYLKAVNDEAEQRVPLGRRDRKPSDQVSGDICFAVSVLDHTRYLQLYRDGQCLLEPSSLNSRLGGMMLQLQLHNIKRLQQSAERMGWTKADTLWLEIRIGRSMVRRPLLFSKEPGAADGASRATLSDIVLIPLSKAFKQGINMRAATDEKTPHAAIARGFQDMMNGIVEGTMMGTVPHKRNKEKNEFADIKIYIKVLGRDIVAKTQVPIWVVPLKCEEVPVVVAVEGAAAAVSSAPGGGVPSGKSGRAASEKLSVAPSGVSGGLGPSGTSVSKMDLSLLSTTVPLVSAAAEAAALASSSGRRFTRVMESYRKDLDGRLEMSVSLQLRPKEGASGAAAAETVEDSEDEEDIAAPPAFIPPPDLDTPVAQAVLGCGPNKLYRLLWKADSDTIKKVQDMEKLKDVQIAAWVVDPVTKTKSRMTSYIKPLNLNIPFVPKEALCIVRVTVQSKEDGGWCVTQRIQTKAPQGDAFFVLMQWSAVHVSATKTRLTVSMHVDFVRSVMAKSIITNQSVADSKRYLTLVLSLIREQVGDPAASGTDCVVEPPQAVSAKPSSDSFLGLPLSLVQLLQLALLTLIFLTIWRLSSTMARSADKVVKALADLAEAVRAATPPAATAIGDAGGGGGGSGGLVDVLRDVVTDALQGAAPLSATEL